MKQMFDVSDLTLAVLHRETLLNTQGRACTGTPST